MALIRKSAAMRQTNELEKDKEMGDMGDEVELIEKQIDFGLRQTKPIQQSHGSMEQSLQGIEQLLEQMSKQNLYKIEL